MFRRALSLLLFSLPLVALTPPALAAASRTPSIVWHPLTRAGSTIYSYTAVVREGQSLFTAVRFPYATTAFHLHDGSQDPPAATPLYPDAGPMVSPAEYRVGLVAVFNGGFKVAAHAGGTLIDGRILSPLVPGMATAVITVAGHLTIGVWGHGLPSPRVHAIAYRQNLPLLVADGRPTPAAAEYFNWGGVVSSWPQPRSALGVTATGDVVYVATAAPVLPETVAAALVAAGVVTGMQLDINPAWPSLGVAQPVKHAAAPGFALALPGEQRNPYVYLTGSDRDFFDVLARPTTPGCTLRYPGFAHGSPAPQPPILVGRCRA